HCRRGPRVKLTPAQRKDMLRLRRANPARWTFAALGRRFGVTTGSAWAACQSIAGRPRKHRGRAFSFVGSLDRRSPSPRERVAVEVATAAGVLRRAQALAGNGHGSASNVLAFALLSGLAR